MYSFSVTQETGRGTEVKKRKIYGIEGRRVDLIPNRISMKNEPEVMFMLEVTSSAVENLKTYLTENNIESAIRIALMQGG